ncbi:hypothetical protein BDR26DRAFT_915695 [Obelidium mucronatum]|nr:hypothetical protein BDR26DRAFT_915695 [Obelidium mucronatum]
MDSIDTTTSTRLAAITLGVLGRLVPAARHSAGVQRLVAVFVTCSLRAAAGRRRALPATLLAALLFAQRLAAKQSALAAAPVDLLLASLMLAETALSDAQTSTASWARLVDPTGASTPEGRKRVAALKWTAFECLDYNATVSQNTFMRWCGMIRKWVGEIPVVPPVVATVPSITTSIREPSPVPGLGGLAVDTPSTSPVAVPSVSPETQVSNSALLTSYLYGLAMGQAAATTSSTSSTSSLKQHSFSAMYPDVDPVISTSAIPAAAGATSQHSSTSIPYDTINEAPTSAMYLNFSLKPPHLSLSTSTTSSSCRLEKSVVRSESRIQSNRAHPYQKPLVNGSGPRRSSIQRVI